jgi:hypothetical protein
MAGVSSDKIIAECELLKDTIEPLLTEMPHLAPEHTELGSFLDNIRTLRTRQQELTGQLRQTTRLRRETEQKGQDLRSRVAAQLRGKLGFKNEQLLKFGVPPRRKAVRRKAEAPAGGTPPAAKPSAASSPEVKTP